MYNVVIHKTICKTNQQSGKKRFAVTITEEKLMLPTGFEPMSTARRAVMIGRYTTGATYILVEKYPQEY
jgi:hypothetical protein